MLDFDTVILARPWPGDEQGGLLANRNNVERLGMRATALIRDGKSQEEVGKIMIAEFGSAPNGMQMQCSLPGHDEGTEGTLKSDDSPLCSFCSPILLRFFAIKSLIVFQQIMEESETT